MYNRDLNSPLSISIFDGEGKKRRQSRKHDRRVRNAAPKKSKSNFGEARGTSTKTEKKGNVYCKPGGQLDKSCSGANPRGYKESGRD